MKAARIGVKGSWLRIAETAVLGPGEGGTGFSPGASPGVQFVVM